MIFTLPKAYFKFWITFTLSSANSFNLDQSKLLSGKGWIKSRWSKCRDLTGKDKYIVYLTMSFIIKVTICRHSSKGAIGPWSIIPTNIVDSHKHCLFAPRTCMNPALKFSHSPQKCYKKFNCALGAHINLSCAFSYPFSILQQLIVFHRPKNILFLFLKGCGL